MKKILFKDSEFSKESIIIKDGIETFSENVIFYIKGLMFEPLTPGITREEIETGMMKKYIGELNTAIIADNEKVFLDNFFAYDDHHVSDILHILTYQEVKEMNLFIKSRKSISLNKNQSFFKNIFTSINDEIIIFLNNKNLKERKTVRIKYKELSEKENYITEGVKSGWEPYFNDKVSNIKNMLEEMNIAKSGNKKYIDDFYYYNKANAIYDKFDEETMREIEEQLTDEDKAEIESWEKESDASEEAANKADSIDEQQDITFNRLTGFKYI